ncbi:hypothetical protein ACGTJS_06475 [Faucicola mancuniensis]|uniref:hypothetical protein n=1 Tax=Faucicola mancuniensis TaxID=1309795 RepID=UPI003977253A
MPVTLNREILVIENANNFDNVNAVEKVNITISEPLSAMIKINGETVNITDEPLEIVLSQQVANVAISTHVVEEINLSTETLTTQ